MTQGRGKYLPATLLLLSTALAWASPIPAQQRVPGSSAGKQVVVAQLANRASIISASTRDVFAATPTGVFAEHASVASAAAQSDAVCGFASPCYSTIRAPEPQSLFLVGSGLIAMASLIRRRIVR
jgi:PEP-CTERM motif